ncbi:TetR/AcrR family transcriptional regulator [Alkalihalobacillus oceani]|uniref:TetR/AcrR family transcriptional regulator n=1 Tax=Halalkalibacter oceani TaxID=1653776 RepID=UPI002040794A|nr:TetR/AcrR family transcriptional regulator [Halalkalibacter oceani]
MTKNKFQQKREHTYHKLLEAGLELFCEQGYAATTLENITARAGYTKGAFYVHFKNKQDFFFHLLDHQGFFFKEIHREDNAIVGEDFRQTVAYWANEVLSRYISSRWTLVFYDFYIQNRHDEKVRTYFREYHSKWAEDIALIIRGLQKKGWVTREKDAKDLAIRCYDIITGGIIHHHMDGEPIDVDKMTEAILALLK